MIDYTVSKIAWREYEERVRTLTPAQDYDLKNERRFSIFPILSGVVTEHKERRGWLSRGVGHVLNRMGAALIAAGSHLAARSDSPFDVSRAGQPETQPGLK